MRCRCEPKSESGTEIIAKNGSYEVKNTDLTKGRNHCNIQYKGATEKQTVLPLSICYLESNL